MDQDTAVGHEDAPIAIGGVGGSGTRLVAELVGATGTHLGDDLNGAIDNLWFTLLFKRLEILDADDAQFDRLQALLVGALRGDPSLGPASDPQATALLDELAASERPRLTTEWLGQRRDSLLHALRHPHPRTRWGWKEPNTHVVIDRLWERQPDLRYVHVVRHGLDMAYSRNQIQLRLWGPRVLGSPGPATPARSLAYWCHVHRRMQSLLSGNEHRMYWLDYDALCRSPAAEADKLCRFLGRDVAAVAPLLETVRAPDVPRHASQSLAGLDPEDIAYVESLGYPIHPSTALG